MALSYLLRMKLPYLSVALSLVTLTAAGASDSIEQSLEIVATAAKVTITENDGGRRAIRLPEVRYTFQLLHRCANGYTPSSLVLTVADSQRSFSVEDLAASDGVVRADLAIPAGQIAPAIVNGFCATGSDELANRDLGRALTLAAMMSASASLRCGNKAEQRIIYSAAPLDVVLVCAAPGDGTASNGDE